MFGNDQYKLHWKSQALFAKHYEATERLDAWYPFWMVQWAPMMQYEFDGRISGQARFAQIAANENCWLPSYLKNPPQINLKAGANVVKQHVNSTAQPMAGIDAGNMAVNKSGCRLMLKWPDLTGKLVLWQAQPNVLLKFPV